MESQLKVASLQDMSCQLLVNAEGTDCLEAKEKVHVIGNRLKLLLKEVSRHIKELEKLLDMSSSQQVSSEQTSLWSISYRTPKKHHLSHLRKTLNVVLVRIVSTLNPSLTNPVSK